MSDPTQLASDPMIARLRRAAIAGAEWLHDVADRLEQLQMPRSEVLRIAEVSDDGADSAALMKALCQKVDAQRKRIAELDKLATAISRDCNNTALERNALQGRVSELEQACRVIAELISGHDGHVFDDITVVLLGTKP